MKYIFFLAILLAAHLADADYDVSIITVNSKPTVEIVVNDRVCLYTIETTDLAANASTEIVNKAIKFCLLVK